MFDGERCIRCNEYFKFEELESGPDGFAICRNCAAKINPSNQKTRSCLNDGKEMKKVLVYNMVLIDKCPSCGGVWLDDEALEILRREMQGEDGGFFNGFLWGMLI